MQRWLQDDVNSSVYVVGRRGVRYDGMCCEDRYHVSRTGNPIDSHLAKQLGQEIVIGTMNSRLRVIDEFHVGQLWEGIEKKIEQLNTILTEPGRGRCDIGLGSTSIIHKSTVLLGTLPGVLHLLGDVSSILDDPAHRFDDFGVLIG